MSTTAPELRRTRFARVLAPLKRLFGPQTSSGARERRDILVLLTAVAFVAVPHFGHLPWWATLLVMLMVLWRAIVTARQLQVPGRALLVPLLFGAAAGVYLQHGTLVGQEAGVTFLLLLMALKVLEMRARRDVFVVIFLCFFILLTQFMHDQGPLIALVTLLALAALFFVLVSVNLDEADLPSARKLKMVGWALLKAAPLTVVLLVLLPRISGPLWGMPGDAASGATGLSNSMSPGSIGQLIESREIAFRARFDGTPPGQERLYWRGPVFGSFNGRTWSPLADRSTTTKGLKVEADRGSLVTYTVTLEPHRRDWLFALEAPAEVPQVGGSGARLTSEMELLAADLVRERTRYAMRSFLAFRLGREADPAELQNWLELPETYNPRTEAFAAALLQKVPAGAADRDAHLVAAALDHFRRGGYTYTLSPPRLGRHSVDEFLFDTRRGYCEHFSSAFVVLMRALGLPARVVTGYQGGELNPVDGFITVRQSDAHAWAEVWLRGRGWSRVDPTAVVAPVRVDPASALARAAEAGRTPVFGSADWLQLWRFNWEAVQNTWNQWVLSYSQDHQRALVAMLGLAPDWESVALVLALVVAALVAAMAAASMRSRAVHDPLGDCYRLLRGKLRDAGVAADDHCGPRELFERSQTALAHDEARQAAKLLARYESMRYSRSSESVAAADVRALRGAVRAFRPATHPE
jgi:transglutaminase-like putative cysteine protease